MSNQRDKPVPRAAKGASPVAGKETEFEIDLRDEQTLQQLATELYENRYFGEKLT